MPFFCQKKWRNLYCNLHLLPVLLFGKEPLSLNNNQYWIFIKVANREQPQNILHWPRAFWCSNVCQKEQEPNCGCAPVRLCDARNVWQLRGIETKLRTAAFVRSSFLLCNAVTHRKNILKSPPAIKIVVAEWEEPTPLVEFPPRCCGLWRSWAPHYLPHRTRPPSCP